MNQRSSRAGKWTQPPERIDTRWVGGRGEHWSGVAARLELVLSVKVESLQLGRVALVYCFKRYSVSSTVNINNRIGRSP